MTAPDAALNAQMAPLGPHDPAQLGAYTLLGTLGQGGMGTVYLGRTETGRLVAIKVIRADVADDHEFRSRFRLEAETARRVARVCTAEVLDAAPDAEQPYLVTEFIEGRTLAKFVTENGPLSAANLEQLAVGVAAALTAIHSAGIVHRDLKPSNVVLSPFGPRVIDFGIARALDAVSDLTGDLQQLGTPAFMAPEQIQGEPVTPAVDIFAWGGLITFAATGRYPFGEGSAQVLLYRAVSEEPRLDGLDSPLREIVASAMVKTPAARPSAQQLMLRLLGEPLSTEQVDPEATVTQVLRDWQLPAPGGTSGGASGGIATRGTRGTSTPATVRGDSPLPRPRRRTALVVAGSGVAVAAVAGAVLALATGSDPGDNQAKVTDILPKAAVALGDDTLVYSSEQDGKKDIFSAQVGPNGLVGSPRKLTHDTDPDTLPVIVGPRRKTVLYTVGDSSPSLKAIAADGSGVPISLFTAGPALDVQIAPDARASVDPTGRFVVIRATRGPNDGSTGLYVIAMDGSSVRQLPVPAGATDPSWSPTDNRIVYFVSENGSNGGKLFTVDAFNTGAQPVALTDGRDGLDADPCWSADGKRIAFRRSAGTNLAEMDIFVMDAAGGAAAQLTNAPGQDQDPSFAAGDDKRIAFTSQRDGVTNREIYVTDANRLDDAHAQRLTPFNGLNATPRWQSG